MLVSFALISCGSAKSNDDGNSPQIRSNEPAANLPQSLDRSECEPDCDLKDGSLTIKFTTEDYLNEITEITKGDVFRVQANFPSSYPEGYFEFTIKYDSNGYENEITSKGYISGGKSAIWN